MNASTDVSTRKIGFYLDAFRLSFFTARLLRTRLLTNVARIEPQFAQTGAYDQLIAEAFSDAWQLIDLLHRVRELAQQNPIIREREPASQIFLRSTTPVEELRHYIQHFRTGIPNSPDVTSPLFGFLSWVSENDASTCFTLSSGFLLPATSTFSCTYDAVEKRFLQKLLIGAGGYNVDLDFCVSQLSNYESEFRKHSQLDLHLNAALGITYSLKAVHAKA